MGKKAICCADCHEYLFKIDPISAGYWLELCDLYISIYFNVIRVPDNDHLKTLEICGFILTADSIPFPIVKLKCVKEDKEGIYFCINKNEH